MRSLPLHHHRILLPRWHHHWNGTLASWLPTREMQLLHVDQLDGTAITPNRHGTKKSTGLRIFPGFGMASAMPQIGVNEARLKPS